MVLISNKHKTLSSAFNAEQVTCSTAMSSMTTISSFSNTDPPQSDMKAELDLFISYIACFDGSSDAWEKAEPHFHRTFHPEAVVESMGGNLDHAAIESFLRNFAEGGFVSEMTVLEVDGARGTINALFHNHRPNEVGDVTEQTLYFQDGMVIRVTAKEADREKFADMLSQISAGVQPIEQRHEQFFACFDGKSGAFERAEPIMMEIFDRERLVIEDEEGSKYDFDWLRDFAKTFAEEGNIARVEKTELTKDGFRCKLRNIIQGVDYGAKAKEVIIGENGKIVYFREEGRPGDLLTGREC